MTMTPRNGVPSMLLFGPNALQVRSTSLVAFTSVDHHRRGRSVNNLLNLLRPSVDRSYSGLLKPHAKRRLRRACEILALCTPLQRVWNPVLQRHQPFKLAFVTLTVPVDLNELQQRGLYASCLKPFLQYLCRTCQVQSYVWKVELTKRGRPHYHIAINQWVHYEHIRNAWNRVLRKHGLLKAYAVEHGHYNAPSTEIKAVKDVTKAAKYLSKYMSKKGDDDRRFMGKLWDCSVGLKGLKWPVFDVCPGVLWKAIDSVGGNERFVCGDERFVMFDVDLSEVVCDLLSDVRELFSRWRLDVQEVVFPRLV